MKKINKEKINDARKTDKNFHKRERKGNKELLWTILGTKNIKYAALTKLLETIIILDIKNDLKNNKSNV